MPPLLFLWCLMLRRWQYLLEKYHLLALLLLPLHYAYFSAHQQLYQTIGLYLLYLVVVAASVWLQPRTAAVKPINGFARLEQYMLLALLFTLLWLFYLPQSPFTAKASQWVWLNCQLAVMGLLLRIYWARQAATTIAASHSPTEHWLIAYASQSGMALQLAKRSASQLQSAGFSVQLAELNQLTQQQLHQSSKALFVVSTYGEGEPPDNASQFYHLAQQWQQSFNQLQFAVLALGDRSYQQFCAFGHWLHGWLHSRDAKAIRPLLELDSADSKSPALNQWQQLLTMLGGNSAVAEAPEVSETWLQAGLHSRYIANPASSGLPCYVVKLQMPAGSQWQAGDLVDVQPENSKCAVALWLTRNAINGCQAVHYQGRHVPLCWALAELELDKVQPPAAHTPLPDWLKQQPRLPLRSYSIASIPEEGQLQLLVRQVQRDDGELGIGSGWLTAWAMEQQPVQLRLRQHTQFHLPADARPLIFIANGTGIAGIRALLAERVKRGQRDNWLLFGERRQDSDFFFARDIQQWQQQGFIRHCDLAFSQQQAEKFYVQHALAAQQARLLEWLEQGAAIYICGSLQGMGQAVHQTLLDAIGSDALAQLAQQGRYRRDLY